MAADLFPERLETERLELTAMTTETVDVREFFRVCSVHEPGIGAVTEHLTWAPHETPKETLDFLESVTEKRENAEGSEYLIRPKESEDGAGEIAGATGVTVEWDRRLATLGMWLRTPFWGRGYSGERAATLLALAFERLELDVVAVTCAEDNEKSRRAIEKYVDAHGGRYEGLVRNGIVLDEGRPENLHRYSVTHEEYEQAAGDG